MIFQACFDIHLNDINVFACRLFDCFHVSAFFHKTHSMVQFYGVDIRSKDLEKYLFNSHTIFRPVQERFDESPSNTLALIIWMDVDAEFARVSVLQLCIWYKK